MSVQTISTLIPAVAPNGVTKDRPSTKILVDPRTGLHYCADCDFTDGAYHKVRGHRRTAHPRPKTTKAPAATKPDLGARIDQVSALLAEVRAEFVDITDEKVDVSWKKRAQDAERRLSQLRRALGSGE